MTSAEDVRLTILDTSTTKSFTHANEHNKYNTEYFHDILNYKWYHVNGTIELCKQQIVKP